MPIQEVVKRHPLTSTKVHHRAKNKQFSTLRCTKTGSTQPKLSAACFVVQSCLADADFVVFSNYCLIGTRPKGCLFSRLLRSGVFIAARQRCIVVPHTVWGRDKGGYSLSRKRISPLGAAARTPHFPSALCAESNRSPEGAQKRSSPFGLPLFYFSQMTGFWRSDSTKALAFSTASARGSLTCSPVRMSLQDTTPALISSSPRK